MYTLQRAKNGRRLAQLCSALSRQGNDPGCRRSIGKHGPGPALLDDRKDCLRVVQMGQPGVGAAEASLITANRMPLVHPHQKNE